MVTYDELIIHGGAILAGIDGKYDKKGMASSPGEQAGEC